MTSSIYKIHDDLHNHGVILDVTVNALGSDYIAPIVTVTDPGGDGAGAIVDGIVIGEVDSLTILKGGNYDTVDGPPDITITGSGISAVATAKVNGSIPAGDTVQVDDQGNGYSEEDVTATISAPDLPGGTQATVSDIVVKQGHITRIDIGDGGSGYSTTPTITIFANGEGGGASASIPFANGPIFDPIEINNAGTNYRSDNTTATVTVGALELEPVIKGGVGDYDVKDGGQGYDIATTIVTVTDSGTGATAIPDIDTIFANNPILTNDIEITSNMVKPGGGGILRVYFSIVFDTSPSQINVFNNLDLKGFLNADNNGNIVDDGYYRFDIDVEADDKINFESTVDISDINFFRSHLVLFGA